MILADSSVWADHFRHPSPDFQQHLRTDRVLMHPWVIGELALGNLPRRQSFIAFLDALPKAAEAQDAEVLEMIEVHGLYGAGIGWVDAHLVASARLTRVELWTRDKRLFAVAQRLGVPARGMH
ncbi:MAG: type II toxin-antitoxin system VapC family toxin [Caulobacteraceae bacterium]|nr:type II toxin-antitoxin system VapC family toxin [Caulobacteraceae bacterium]